MSKVVLKCENLNKKLSNKTRITDVSFSVYENDILGFIGPNGAGKTTIIKLILGLYRYDSGTVEINGYDLKKDFVKAISGVGAIIENPDLYMYMTGYENIMISAKIYNIEKEQIDKVVKLVGLEDKINEKVSKYSLGMRQRLGIAQAIVHNPRVLILDEPTNGLDPEGIIDLNNLLKKLAQSGMAIMISSHILSELELLCNKVCFINNGRIINYKTMFELQTLANNNNNYIIELNTIKLNKILENYDYKIIDSDHIELSIDRSELNKFIKFLLDNNVEIYEIKKQVLSLKNIFLNMIGGNIDV